MVEHTATVAAALQALTTAAVAQRAGMSERTMLYHLPTRDHLLVAALERVPAWVGERLAAH